MNIFRFLPLLAPFILAAPAQAEKQPIGDFRLGWKSGAVYEEKITIVQKVAVPFRGNADATSKLSLKLKPEGHKLGMKIEHFKTLIDMPLPKTNEKFDSLTPAEGNRDIAKFYEVLHALPLKATLDNRGQITEMSGLEDMKQENPLLNRFLGKDQIAALMRQGWFLSLPPKSIGINESWPYRLTFPTPLGPLKMEGTYTLLGSEDRGTVPCWKLAMKGSMTSAPLPLTVPAPAPATGPSGTENPKELEIQEKLAKLGLAVKKATMEGNIWFNPAEQLIHDSEVSTSISISTAKTDESASALEIPISQKLTLELRRVP